MLSDAFQRLVRSSSNSRKRKSRQGIEQRQRRRMFLETLEDRRVLATLFWQGDSGVDTNWSTAANWNTMQDGTGADQAPADTDTLVFDSTTTGLASYSSNNDIAMLSDLAVQIVDNDADAGDDFAISGLSFGLGAGGVTLNQTGGDNATISADLTLDAAAALSVAAGTLAVTGSITAGANTLTVDGAGDSELSGIVDGSAGIIKSDAGTLTLSAANTYAGVTQIAGGEVVISDDAALGATGAGNSTAVNVTTTLRLTGDITIGEELDTMDGTLISDGNNFLNGAVEVNNANSTFEVTNASLLTVIGDLTGTTGFHKTGPGNLRISGVAKTYSGTASVDEGRLSTTAANRLPAGSSIALADVAGATFTLDGNNQTIASLSGGGATGGTVNLGLGTLTVGDNNNATYSGVISGVNGGLTKVGAGTLTLSADNSYTGATNVQAGTIQITNAGALGGDTSGTTVDAGAILNLNGDMLTVSEPLNLNGTLLNDGGDNTWSGDVVLASTIEVDGTDTLEVSGAVSGAGGLTKTGTGTLVLSNNTNSYAGDTNVNAGELQAGAAGVIPDTSVVVLADAAGVTLNLNGNNEDVASISGGGAAGGNITLGVGTLGILDPTGQTYDGVISGAGGLTIGAAATGTLTLGGTNTYMGATNVNGGTLEITNAAALGDATGSTSVASGATLQVNGTGLTVAEPLNTLAGTLANTGGDNNWSGTITLDGGTFDVDNMTSLSLDGQLTGSNGLTKVGQGTLVITNNMMPMNDYTGTTAIDNGTLQLGAAGVIPDDSAVTVALGADLDLNGFDETFGSLSGAGDLDLGTGIFTFGGDANAVFSGVISGDGGIVKEGTGSLTLSGANTYDGTTTISEGTLIAQTDTALGSTMAGTSVALGATLRIDGNGLMIAEELNPMNGTVSNTGGDNQLNGNITINSTIDVAMGTTMTVAMQISGAGGLTKTGAGTLILTNSTNNYTGDTTIDGGTLQLGANDVLPDTTNVLINNGAELEIMAFNDTIAGAVVSDGTVDGTGTLSTANTFELQTATVNAVLDGTGGVSKTTMGTTAVLNNTGNAYDGATNIQAGTLQLGAAGVIPDTSTVTADGTLDLNGFSETIDGLSGSSRVTNSVAAAVTLTIGATGGSADFAGIIEDGAGTVAVTKIGAGTQTLSGTSANTFSGATTVNGGTLSLQKTAGLNAVSNSITVGDGAGTDTLMLAANDQIPNDADVTVSAMGGVFDLNGSDETIDGLTGGGIVQSNVAGSALSVGSADGNADFSGVLQDAGGGELSLNKLGSGIQTLSGTAANTFTGSTTVSAGTLELNKSADTAAVGGMVVVGDAAGSDLLTLSNDGQIPDTVSVSVLSSGTFDLDGQSETIDTLTGNGTVESSTAGGALTVGGGGNNGDFSGVIQDGGGDLSLTKVGAGTQTLSGTAANTFTGATTVNGGTLVLGKSAGVAAVSASVTIGDGTDTDTLSLSAGEQIPNDADVTVSAMGGVFDLNGNNETIDGLTGGGVVQSSAAGGTLLVGSDDGTADFAGILQDGTGDFSLTKLGTGTQTLSGTAANTFTGSTTVNAGTLELSKSADTAAVSSVVVIGDAAGDDTLLLSNDGQLPLTADVDISSSGTLDLGGNTNSLDALTGTGTVESAAAGGNLTVGASNHPSADFAGVIQDGAGDVTLTKTGTGTQTLSGATANTYSGTTTIDGGTLSLNKTAGVNAVSENVVIGDGAGADILNLVANNQIPDTADVTVTAGGGVLQVNGQSEAIDELSGGGSVTSGAAGGALTVGSADGSANFAGVISGDLSLTKAGTGNQTLSGSAANTHSGATTVNAGTLTLDKDDNVAAVSTTVVVGDGAGTDSLTLESDEQIPDTADVTINAGGIVDLNGHTETIDELSGTGTVESSMAGGSLTVGADDGSADFAGVLQDGGGDLAFTKAGTGTQTLSGSTANTFTGATTVNSGTLSLNKDAGVDAVSSNIVVGDGAGTDTLLLAQNEQLPNTADVNVMSSGVFDLDGNTETMDELSGSGTVTSSSAGGDLTVGADNGSADFSGVITGDMSFTKAGTGNQTLSGSGANTYTGTTTISGGTLTLNKDPGVPAISGTVALDAGTLKLGGNEQLLDTSDITLGAAGLLDLCGNTETIDELAGSGTVESSAAGGSLILGADNGTADFAGVIQDGGGDVQLTKSGTGNQTLSGSAANTFTGQTTVNAGTLTLAKDAGVSAVSSVVVIGDGTGTDTISLTNSEQMPNDADVSISSGGVMDVNGQNETIDELSGSGSVESSAAAGLLTVGANDGDADFSGVIQNGAGDTAFTKSGTGTQTLSGSAANTFTGATTVNGGTLVLSKDAGTAAVSSNVTIGDGAGTDTVQLDNNEQLPDTADVTVAAAGGVLNLNGQTETMDGLSGGGTVESAAGGASLTVGADNGSADFGGVIQDGAGNVELTKTGTGNQTLSGSAANTYTGNTLVNGGTLTLNKDANTAAVSTSVAIGDGSGTDTVMLMNDEQIPDVADVVVSGSGGVMNINGQSETIDELSGAGLVESAAANGSLTVGQNDGSADFAGVIQDGGGDMAFTKSGTGTQTLSGSAANTFTGQTTVNGGTLMLSKDANTAAVSSNVLVGDGAGTDTLMLTNGEQVPNTGDVTITAGGGVMDLNGQTETIDELSGGGLVESAAASAALTVGDDNGSADFAGVVQDGAGDVRLTKTGTGTQTLSGSAANTYTGLTLVDDGTLMLNKDAGVAAVSHDITVGDGAGSDMLKLGNAEQIPDAGDVMMAASGIFDLNGQAESIDALAGVGGALVTSDAAVAVTLTVGANNNADSDPTDFAGVVQDGNGTVGLDKIGTARQTLSGTNTYGGTTTVTNGSLEAKNASALGATTGNTEVMADGILELSGNGGGAISYDAEPLTLDGGKLANVTQANTYNGPITLSANSTVESQEDMTTLNVAGTVEGNQKLTLAGGGNQNYTGQIGNINNAADRLSEIEIIPEVRDVTFRNRIEVDGNVIQTEDAGSVQGTTILTDGELTGMLDLETNEIRLEDQGTVQVGAMTQLDASNDVELDGTLVGMDEVVVNANNDGAGSEDFLQTSGMIDAVENVSVTVMGSGDAIVRHIKAGSSRMVKVQAVGGMIDHPDGNDTNVLEGMTGDLDAMAGIGNGTPVRTKVMVLEAENASGGGSGVINVQNDTTDVTLNGVANAADQVEVRNSGNMTVAAGTAVSGNGDVMLRATDAFSNFSLPADTTVMSTGGTKVMIEAGGDISLQDDALVQSTDAIEVIGDANASADDIGSDIEVRATLVANTAMVQGNNEIDRVVLDLNQQVTRNSTVIVANADVTVMAGNSGDILKVVTTGANTPVNLVSGEGDDSIEIAAETKNLDAIVRAVTVNGGTIDTDGPVRELDPLAPPYSQGTQFTEVIVNFDTGDSVVVNDELGTADEFEVNMRTSPTLTVGSVTKVNFNDVGEFELISSGAADSQYIYRLNKSTDGVIFPLDAKNGAVMIEGSSEDDLIVIQNRRGVAGSIIAATQTDPVSIVSVNHGLSNGARIFIEDVGGMTQLNERGFEVTVVDDDIFTLQDIGGGDVNGTAFDSFTKGGRWSLAGEIENKATVVNANGQQVVEITSTDHGLQEGNAIFLEADMMLKTFLVDGVTNNTFQLLEVDRSPFNVEADIAVNTFWRQARAPFELEEASFVHIKGLAGDDRIYNDTNIPSLIEGGDGNDLLVGGDAVDVLIGGGGADALFGNAGNDHLFADLELVDSGGDITITLDNGVVIRAEFRTGDGTDAANDLLNGGADTDNGFTVSASGVSPDVIRNMGGEIAQSGAELSVIDWLKARFRALSPGNIGILLDLGLEAFVTASGVANPFNWSSDTPSGEGESTPLHNLLNSLDVNEDGNVSPVDALAIINDLNANGSRDVDAESDAEGESGRLYVDTSGDNVIAAGDVLLVINYLNSKSNTAEAEGEAFPQTESSTLSTHAAAASDGTIVLPSTQEAAPTAHAVDDIALLGQLEVDSVPVPTDDAIVRQHVSPNANDTYELDPLDDELLELLAR